MDRITLNVGTISVWCLTSLRRDPEGHILGFIMFPWSEEKADN